MLSMLRGVHPSQHQAHPERRADSILSGMRGRTGLRIARRFFFFPPQRRDARHINRSARPVALAGFSDHEPTRTPYRRPDAPQRDVEAVRPFT